MPYVQFNSTKPTGAANGSTTLQHVRENLAAIRDIVAMGAAPGWAYSVGAGTNAKPTTMLWKNGTEWIRAVVTYGTSGGAADNAVTVVFSYSANSGVAYDTIGTQSLNYDANGDVVSTSWVLP